MQANTADLAPGTYTGTVTVAATDAKLPPPATHAVDFEKEIKPLFEAACIKCHAKGKDKGGLSVETREAFMKGGDTGAAAIEVFRGHANIDVFILFPEGRVSPFQQRQMTTTGAPSVSAWARSAPTSLSLAAPASCFSETLAT